jgi:hypothetical protein
MNKPVRASFYDQSKKIITSQDFQQQTNMVISVSLELYRVMISSLLIIFVPQKCEDHVCSLMENLHSDNDMYFVGLIINYITVIAFVIMYIFEMRREEKLIKLLEVNNTISTDNESVGKRLSIFSDEKRQKLFAMDSHYQYASYSVMCIYAVNIVFSGIVIHQYSLGNQTLVIFLTNLLFMITKLSNVYIIINTDKNIFFSAYLNTKVQFNDIDPHELEKIEKRKSIESLTLHIGETDDEDIPEVKEMEMEVEMVEPIRFAILDTVDLDIDDAKTI